MDDDKTEDLDSTEAVRPDSPDLPERVGPYRILQEIGERVMLEFRLGRKSANVAFGANAARLPRLPGMD